MSKKPTPTTIENHNGEQVQPMFRMHGGFAGINKAYMTTVEGLINGTMDHKTGTAVARNLDGNLKSFKLQCALTKDLQGPGAAEFSQALLAETCGFDQERYKNALAAPRNDEESERK